MSPHVPAAPHSHPPLPPAATSIHSAAAPAYKPTALWVAVGVLALSVLALGATLVVQNTARPGGADARAGAPALLGTAPGLNFASNQAPALAGQWFVAMNSVAATQAPPPAGARPAVAQAYQPLQPLRPLPAQPPAPVQAAAVPVAVPLPVQAAAPLPVCSRCGQVESVQAVQQAAPATGVGAVAGGVLGAVVGNQVGKGSGRAAATVLGAVGGGYVGHKVEERTRTQTVYQVAIRMDDGSLRRFTRAQPPAVGTPVVLQGKGFRVDDGSAARSHGAPHAGAVRVADSY